MFKSLAPGAIGVKADLQAGIQYAKNAGFEGLDISISTIADLVDERGPSDVKGMFDAEGIRISAWGLGVAWAGSDDEYAEGLRELPRLAAAGAAVGCTRVSQWVPPASDDLPFRENYRWHVTRFRGIAEILRDHGCSIGLEFIGPRTSREGKKYGFIYSLQGMLALSESIGTGNVGLLLDAWHWYTSLGTLSDLNAITAEDVVTVHVNDAPAGIPVADQIDNQRALPSETGVIDLVGFLKTLKEMGYQGPVTPEPFSQRVRELPPEEACRQTHDGLDRAWKAAGL